MSLACNAHRLAYLFVFGHFHRMEGGFYISSSEIGFANRASIFNFSRYALVKSEFERGWDMKPTKRDECSRQEILNCNFLG